MFLRILLSSFFLYSYSAPRDLPSFPTRRSSDLRGRAGAFHGRLRGIVIGLGAADLAFVVVAREERHAHREADAVAHRVVGDRKSTRLNSSHVEISYAVFCLKKKKKKWTVPRQ